MMGVLLALVVLAMAAALVLGLGYFTHMILIKHESMFGSGDKPDRFEKTLAVGAALSAAFIATFTLSVMAGDIDFTSIPDGCYKIYSTSGTSVTTIPNSQGGVTVVPIVTNDRVYEPIPCN